MTTGYNRKIRSMMRSNMDCQYILDPYTACSYIVNYINKADKGLSRTLKELYERRARDPNSDVFDTLRSMATTYYNTSGISAKEAAYNLLRIRMSEASTGCIHIPTARLESRQHMLRDLETLRVMDPKSTDCFQLGLIEHYTNHPDEFESLNLAQFAACFEISRKGPSSRSTRRDNEHEDQQNEQSDAGTDDAGADARIDNAGGPANSFYPLRDVYPEMWIKRRKKSRVIRYYNFNKIDKSRSDYFRTLLMPYKPWRNEETELLNVNTEEVVNINSELIAFNFQEFTKIDEDALEDYYNFGRYTMEMDDGDQGDYHRDTDISEDLSGGTSTKHKAYHRLLSTLIAKQRLLLTHVIHHIRYNKDETIVLYVDTSAAPDSNNTFSPMHLLVAGGAGTGKSMLINVLHQSLQSEFDKNRDHGMEVPSVLLGALTGIAAFNIGGQTIHSIFDFPKNQGALPRLSADVSHSMAVVLKDVQVIIIDEISMVSVMDVDWNYKRLKDLFHPQKPFGGKTIICFGDFNQLPPVRGSALYTKNVGSRSVNPNVLVELFSFDNWGLFKVHKLTEIMRQRDDHDFAVALNKLAIGKMIERDIALFQSRVYRMPCELLAQMKNFSDISLPDDITNSKKPINLLHSNNKVRHFNNLILDGIDGDNSISTAFDIVLGNQSYKAYAFLSQVGEDKVSHDVKGLIKNLKLKVNGKYMISIKVHTADGLVYGTRKPLRL
ncbi:hypothetical protein [Parasitella parasitica]|uniref:ATP-dependent DNA helicase n=1 Tax=Parasitella parasitica TaxID=35722 RepID=A0A0B7NA74_9FUNG|nr:hypothetical protein [Parasitella parasitica]